MADEVAAKLARVLSAFEAMSRIDAVWTSAGYQKQSTWQVVPEAVGASGRLLCEQFQQTADEAARALAQLHGREPAGDGVGAWLDHLKDSGLGFVVETKVDCQPAHGQPYTVRRGRIENAARYCALAVRKLIDTLPAKAQQLKGAGGHKARRGGKKPDPKIQRKHRRIVEAHKRGDDVDALCERFKVSAANCRTILSRARKSGDLPPVEDGNRDRTVTE